MVWILRSVTVQNGLGIIKEGSKIWKEAEEEFISALSMVCIVKANAKLDHV